MDLYWKAIAIVLITSILGLVLGKDMAILLCLCGCAMGLMAVLHYLQPVISLIAQLSRISSLEKETLGILLKILGVGLVSETASLLCSDGGSSAFGSVIRFLSGTAVLWVSIPVFQSVIQMIQQILGEV